MSQRGPIVIAGSAGGIGSALRARLEVDGDVVVGWDRNPATDDGVSLQVDLTNSEACRNAAEETITRFGVPAAVVHSAAASTDGSLLETSPEAFAAIHDVNVLGALRLVQAFAPAMIKAGAGQFVFVSSINARFSTPGLGAYAASKAALENLTMTLAEELAPQGIRVNAVAPASVATPLLMDKFRSQTDPEASLNANKKRHPLGRIAEPKEVADLIAFVLSGRASFITGAVLPIDGGASVTRR